MTGRRRRTSQMSSDGRWVTMAFWKVASGTRDIALPWL